MRLRGLRILARMIARHHLRDYPPLKTNERPTEIGTSDDGEPTPPLEPLQFP